MPPAFREIVDDITAEHAALARVLDALDADQWERPTHAPGWSVRLDGLGTLGTGPPRTSSSSLSCVISVTPVSVAR